MRYELSQSFYFEAAHTLRRKIDVEPSLRIHGHTYIAEVTLAGEPDPDSGMLVDLAHLRAHIETLRQALDHRFLDEVADLGPATLENLCAFIWRAMEARYAQQLDCVEVRRQASGDACRLRR
ncbi:MAG: 6-carboxytetrahydropterin synthase [Hydrogenophaga sp.]|uniref:6-pyruvoyl trahydropterin synthase family protein n=1 Tax=Hydrogenophaga sp. TaxID=1904254 RepID=UPI0025BD898D|nr:6-carboxytetrahydropterin synthase [Hydrogenophaga sp.]MBT9551027.1 6-carboxytetrahydropterin synthase [Hydrogenophaga sp.]